MTFELEDLRYECITYKACFSFYFRFVKRARLWLELSCLGLQVFFFFFWVIDVNVIGFVLCFLWVGLGKHLFGWAGLIFVMVVLFFFKKKKKL